MKQIKKRNRMQEPSIRINSLSEGWAIARHNVKRIDSCGHSLMSAIDELDNQIVECSYDSILETAGELSENADYLIELALNIKAASDGMQDLVDATVSRRKPRARNIEVEDDEFDPEGWEDSQDPGTARNKIRIPEVPRARQSSYRSAYYEDEGEEDGYDDYDEDIEITSEDIDRDLEDFDEYAKHPRAKTKRPEPVREEHIESSAPPEKETGQDSYEEQSQKKRPRRKMRSK